MSTQDIVKVVDPIAAKYGVPTFIWETIAEVESGFNPAAVGDNGTSFGLFQLHRGGQLGNLTPTQAADPATNANAAMPAIAKAWQALSKGIDAPNVVNGMQSPGDYNFWYKFAILSGHPGGDSGAADSPTKREAQRLQQEAVTLSANPLPGGGTPATRQPYNTAAGGCNIWDPFSYGNCIGDLQQGAVKVGLFLLAIMVVIVGIWAISKGE